jgi:membrane associated rhomboid family serine protease
MVYVLLFFQNLNILLNGFETGTQGSIDGYIVSLYVGIILSIVIILVQIFHKNNLEKGVKIINIILLIFSLLLYDKSYFLDKKNFKWHKFPPRNYSIEFIIKGDATGD